MLESFCMFRKLEPARIVDTATRLHQRVDERFPGSGLSKVAVELEAVARESAALASVISAPDYRVRAFVVLGLTLSALALGAALFGVRFEGPSRGFLEVVQGVESMVNDAIFVGVGVYFLLGIEVRMKRRKALRALHVLRSLAHIVDMHQLTKDPERVVNRGNDTASSPERSMTPFELTRYLDYCTEMLAIISKIAALYVQEFDDAVTVDAASAVEDLSVNLSRTIWQKIVVLERTMAPPRPEAVPAPA